MLIHHPLRTGPGRLAGAALLGLLVGPAAWGQSSPYVIGASETISHNSNVVQLPDDTSLLGPGQQPKSKTDWIASTALFGGIDQPFGRQRAFGNLTVQHNHYRYNDYDNLAYGLATGLVWSTIERVSGTVKFNSNRTLANFNANTAGAPDIQKNIEQTNQFAATASVGGVTDLTFDGGIRYQTQRFSAVGNRLRQTQVSLGAHHRLGGELTLGAGVRFKTGRFPDSDDSFKGRTLDFSVDWVPSPISTVNSNVSFGKSDHSNASARDYSGVTGSLGWIWKPGGRLAFDTRLSRLTGEDASFGATDDSGRIVDAQSDRSRITNTLSLNASYEATAKILVNAGFTRASRRLTEVEFTPVPQTKTGNDRLLRWQLGARWLPTRTLEFGCTYSRETRRAAPSELTYSYAGRTVGCFGQVSLNP